MQEAQTVTSATAVEWEEVDCPLCGGGNWSIVVEAPDPLPATGAMTFAVVQCDACGLCYTNPRPTPATIGLFYPERYRPHHKKRKRKRPSRWRRLSPLRLGKDQERVSIPWRGQGRLLDFGCGSASFLERMHCQGWHVTGLDSSPATAQRIRRELEVAVHVGSFPHPELESSRFDVITMWHSLEHVHQPLEVLRAAHELLVPGGQLIVGVPNIDSLPYRWFGADWFGLDLPRHLTHFTPQTLQLMLERAGFRPDPMRRIRHSEWLRSSARLKSRRQGATRWQRWLCARPVSSLAAWYCFLTDQSDCIHVSSIKSE